MCDGVESRREEMERSSMERRSRSGKKEKSKSYTLPSSPSHSFSSSSSSDFEFTISISPRKSSTTLCPADELFYKGQLLPLHLNPRISMVRTLLLSSSSSSSSSTAPRDSTGSSSTSSFTADLPDCDSSRPSSVTDDDDLLKRLHNPPPNHQTNNRPSSSQFKKTTHKYFSLSRFSSVFRKENNSGSKTTREGEKENQNPSGSSSVKRMSATAKEVFRKYLKKVKPLYEKLSQKQQQQTVLLAKTERSAKEIETEAESGKRGRKENVVGVLSHSFSGNLRYPRRRSCVSSCPSSMRSSPSHSGVLSQKGVLGGGAAASGSMYSGDTSSSMEELQSAIQGAIAHCKNSLMQNKTVVSNEINLI